MAGYVESCQGAIHDRQLYIVSGTELGDLQVLECRSGSMACKVRVACCRVHHDTDVGHPYQPGSGHFVTQSREWHMHADGVPVARHLGAVEHSNIIERTTFQNREGATRRCLSRSGQSTTEPNQELLVQRLRIYLQARIGRKVSDCDGRRRALRQYSVAERMAAGAAGLTTKSKGTA